MQARGGRIPRSGLPPLDTDKPFPAASFEGMVREPASNGGGDLGLGNQGSVGRADEAIMPQFVIERNMPGVGNASAEDMKGASQNSCGVLRELGPDIQWVHSYVTDDKIYCVYRAPDENIIREHARRGGLPADSISRVRRVIDPTTAE